MMSLLRKTNTQRALSSPCNPWHSGRFGRAAARIWERVYTERTGAKGTKVDIVVTSVSPPRALRAPYVISM